MCPERIQVRARVAAPADAASAAAAEAPVVAVPVVAPPPVVATPRAEPEPVRAVPESVVREVVVNAPERELAAIAPSPAVKVPPPPAETVAPLQVTTMVEPVVPRRLLDRVRGEIEVVVAFTVNPDGSVANPSVQSSSNRLINATVLEAVAQWRYAPVAAPREHAVQLVMRAGD